MDLFEFDEEVIVKNEKVVMVDGHNLAYRNAYSVIYKNPEDNGVFEIWRHQMIQSIFYLVKKFKPSKLILAFDTKGSWRYSIYSEYKANRKANRAKGKIVLNYESFIENLEQFINDITELFSNIYVLKLKTAEADDIIAVLAKYMFQDDEVVIISSDGDLHQLITKNIKQFDPMKNKMVECINVKKELQLKFLKGDSSDNIKGIKKGVGIKTAEKILAMGFDKYIETLDEKEQDYVIQNHERNKILIDLNEIPEDLKENIINIYANYEIKDFNGKAIVKYLLKNKLQKHFSEWNATSEFIKKLS